MDAVSTENGMCQQCFKFPNRTFDVYAEINGDDKFAGTICLECLQGFFAVWRDRGKIQEAKCTVKLINPTYSKPFEAPKHIEEKVMERMDQLNSDDPETKFE